MPLKNKFILIFIILFSFSANANTPKSTGKYKNWESFTVETDKGKICFAQTLPTKRAPASIQREKSKIFVNGEDFTDKIRTEKVAMLASKIAINKSARDMLEKYQRSYIKDPGLVADGRDMGTKVFSEAKIKFFLTASVEKRAERRLNQLKDQGISANLRNLIQKLLLRDKADMERTISPLIPAEDAIIIDTSDITASEVFNTAIKIIRENLKII